MKKQLAKLTKTSVDQIKNDLTQLRALGLIEYELQKETPQLYFHTNRAPAEHLQINTEQYRRRKEEFTFRTDTMLRYMETASVCRSTFIGNYFADTELKDCGVCDNCLKRRSLPLSEKEFAVIKQRIDNVLTNKNVAVQDVLQACRGIKKEKLWKVLEYLQGENLITIEADGNVKGAARNNV
jgi:ATP-dependent DNA helicase RecQ